MHIRKYVYAYVQLQSVNYLREQNMPKSTV